MVNYKVVACKVCSDRLDVVIGLVDLVHITWDHFLGAIVLAVLCTLFAH